MEDKIIIAQDNLLTQSRQQFNVIEKRCLYQIIREVRRLYIDSNTGQKDLFDDMYLTMPADVLRKLGEESKDVFQALKNLAQKEIEINNDDLNLFTHWVLVVKHDKKKDIFNVQVSKEIMPYLVELCANFTPYDLTVAISLKSRYSQRFYEFCSQYRNRANKTFFFTVEKLREMFILDKKYENGSDFKKNVLDVAQKELKDQYDKGQCDLWFEYSVKDTDKRRILSYFFFVHTKESEYEKLDYQNINECIKKIGSILESFFPRDKKFVRRVLQEVQLHPNIAQELAEKLDKKVLDYNRKDIPPIIRWVLKNDYGIQ